MNEATCSVDGCENPANGSRGWCRKHYARWTRHGDPLVCLTPEPGAGSWPDSGGYLCTTLPVDHPLRQPGKSRQSRVHRVVLFDKVGYGPHLCHWCQGPINWHADLVVDHIDEDKTNNNPTNLVESCMACNTKRSAAIRGKPTHCFRGHEYTPDNVYMWGGARTCKTCSKARDATYRQRRRARKAA